MVGREGYGEGWGNISIWGSGTRTEYRGAHYRQQPTTLCHSRGSHYLLFEETFCSKHFVILREITLDRLIPTDSETVTFVSLPLVNTNHLTPRTDQLFNYHAFITLREKDNETIGPWYFIFTVTRDVSYIQAIYLRCIVENTIVFLSIAPILSSSFIIRPKFPPFNPFNRFIRHRVLHSESWNGRVVGQP